MAEGRTQHMAVKLAGLVHIIDIASLAGEETRVLGPTAGAANFWSLRHSMLGLVGGCVVLAAKA
jgi:hypothetical protein